jgi:hypothetical protein
MRPIKLSPDRLAAVPEIAKSEVQAVKRFLTSARETDHRTHLADSPNEPKGPTVRNGIARSRIRAAARSAD